MSVDLPNGRTITVPLARYPRLLDATPAQRANWQPCGGGFRIHGPDIHEQDPREPQARLRDFAG